MLGHIVPSDLVGDALIAKILDCPIENSRRVAGFDGGHKPGVPSVGSDIVQQRKGAAEAANTVNQIDGVRRDRRRARFSSGSIG